MFEIWRVIYVKLFKVKNHNNKEYYANSNVHDRTYNLADHQECLLRMMRNLYNCNCDVNRNQGKEYASPNPLLSLWNKPIILLLQSVDPPEEIRNQSRIVEWACNASKLSYQWQTGNTLNIEWHVLSRFSEWEAKESLSRRKSQYHKDSNRGGIEQHS